MRIALVLVVVTSRLAVAQPTPPADPCARAAFQELAQLQARIAAFEAGNGVTLADILDLAMSSPTSYAWQAPGSARFAELFAAADPNATRPILTAMKADVATLLGSNRPVWAFRCEAYPTSHQQPSTPTRAELATRRAIAKTTLAAHARAVECAKLQGRVLAMSEDKRLPFAGAIDRCHRDLEVAQQRCQRDFAVISRTDSFAPYEASLGVSNLIELRRRTATVDDVAAVRRHVIPVLDALQPPLSSLAAPARAALTRKDPVEVLYELSGAMKVLYSPCEALWTSSSRCIVAPSRCKKHLD